VEQYGLKARSKDQSVPSADQVVYIGIDQGLNKWVYAIRWGGEQHQAFAGPSELSHLQALVKRFAPNEVHLAHEACGFGYAISRWAQQYTEQLVRVTVVPPSTIEQQPGRRVKTDRIDARNLARKLEQGELKRVWVPPPEQEQARQISRTQQQMAKERRRAQMQVRSLLKAHSYKAPPGTRSWTSYVRWLEQLSLPAALQQCVGCLMSLREHAARNESELLRHLHQMSQEEPWATVVHAWTTEMTGVGWLSAIRNVVELGDVARFPRRGSLPHYLGLTPSEYSTGDAVQRGAVLRCGPAQVRSWLIENAWVAVRRDGQLKELFYRIAGPSPTADQKKVAIVAVAHRMAIKLRALWKQALAPPALVPSDTAA
jgi:transposase